MRTAKNTNPFRLLPHGWKKAAAQALGVHPHTVSNALRRGEGDATYRRIVECAAAMYGSTSAAITNAKKQEKP